MTSESRALKAAWRRSCTIKERKTILVPLRSASGGFREEEIRLPRKRRGTSPSLRVWCREAAADRKDPFCEQARAWLRHKGLS